MSTVFDNIVASENDHTNLLRNIMERHPKAAAAVLSYFIGRDVSEVEAASFEQLTQHQFVGENGRAIPDILIRGKNFHCIIEAKIYPALDLTENQQLGYPGCFPEAGECHLVFLVPDEWMHSDRIRQISFLQTNIISIHTAYWDELVSKLEEVSAYLADAVVIEAINFWKWRFQSKSMTQKEKDSLTAWSEEKYSAMRKLEKTVSRAKKLFDVSGFETETDMSDVCEYGFYIKQGRLYILWVGIWTLAPSPLSFGFHSTKSNWLRPKLLPEAPSTAQAHHLWSLDSEVWDDPQKLYASVSTFLRSYPSSDLYVSD